ncbi:MAG: hypothetical protein AB7I27_14265 [Bacteriovoracaceae bacterium]
MKILVLVTLLFTSLAYGSFEQSGPNESNQDEDVGDVFGRGTDEFAFEKFDDKSILVAINRDAQMACDRSGLCRLSSVTSNDRRFTATFSIGEGNSMGAGVSGGSGTNIIIPSNGNLGEVQPYYGLTLRYTIGKCTQTVNVPRSVYYAINRYMYGLLTEEGGTRRGFTPADEAMIMFYTTIMKQASGCVAGQ